MADPATDAVRIEAVPGSCRATRVVNWCLGNRCTYRCSYCPTGLHRGDAPWPAAETVLRFCEHVRRSWGVGFGVTFSGGEPTLWHALGDVAAALSDHGVAVGLVTNGYRPPRWWRHIVPSLRYVCLSYHHEFGDGERMLELAAVLAPRVTVHVNLMTPPGLLERSLCLASRFEALTDVSVAIRPIRYNISGSLYGYQAHELAAFRALDSDPEALTTSRRTYALPAVLVTRTGGRIELRTAQDLLLAAENRWPGWECHVGLEQLVVEISGDIFRAWCRVGGRLGSIHERFPDLPDAPVVCTESACRCDVDMLATKMSPSQAG